MATILVVDDLSANREVLVALLRYKGHRLLEAEDGNQGLAVVQAEHPDAEGRRPGTGRRR